MNTENKRIVLRENGVPQVFSVNELEMKTSSRNVAYIPTDRYNLAEIEIDRNGIYPAYRYSADGFSNVRVNIELPYTGTTRSGIEYQLYEDVTGKPHIEVLLEEIE